MAAPQQRNPKEDEAAPRMKAAASTEERANKWAVLALAGIAAFMTTLDSSIVNISLPSIARAFGVALTGAVDHEVMSLSFTRS
jgi:hypothetical protein